MANSDRYQTIKVLKGTLRPLRQLSFEMNLPIVQVIKKLTEDQLQRMGVKQK